MQSVYRPTGTFVTQKTERITIERNVPIPIAHGRPRRGPHLAVQLAMEKMEIGESFVSLLDSKATLSIAKGVRLSMGRKFATRTVVEDDKSVVRVWRLK